ncbi:MAG: preprotein translocase subunit SecA [bacterium]
MSIFDKIFRDPNEKIIKSLLPIVEKINSLEKKYQAMSDEELKAQTVEFRKRLGVELFDEILPDAFAVVREAARRVLKQRHYDAQLMGGIVLHRGQIAEMRTGEGKTLVATLPAYLNALAGNGAHVITVNDYLAKRDAEWMGKVYNFLGLSVGCITHETAHIYDADGKLVVVPRKQAYACDILYGTNNEFGFDYLRDNMAPDLESMAQRDLSYAIVDEVDSILIDEARTPLIISAPAEESTDKYYKFSQLVERLSENEDYNVDEKMRAATLTEAGMAKMEKFLGVENIYVAGGVSDAHHIEQALKARVLFKRDRDYVVKEGEIIIVDEFTGRLMHGRRYSEGLHQAIEAKEKVEIKRESRTLATITFQNYFRMYKKLSGMTGTAVTEAEEFSKIYNLETVVIPTNRPMIREDKNDLIYRTEIGKFKAVAKEVRQRHDAGQPVLVGTISIEKNEILGEIMEREGLRPQILNAKHHEKEAQIIAQAGKIGAVTIATNMAGRGVDIVLDEEVKNLGGLHIIGTERHESRRIDNQLRGRAGRQGDPGSSQFYVSMEDDLMRIFGGDRMKSLMSALKVPEDMPIENGLVSRSIESAQRKVEGNNFDIRKHLVEYDDVINKHRETIYRKRREILDLAEKKVPVVIARSESDEAISRKLSEHEIATLSSVARNDKKNLSSIILKMIENEIEQAVIFHTAAENSKDWDAREIYQIMSTIFHVEPKLEEEIGAFMQDGDKLDKVKIRTKIIEYLVDLAKKNYEKISIMSAEAGVDWAQFEKSVLIRSIDMLWIDHLEAMDHMRHGIGLRGYGQRDPLIEYKKEAYILYNELNNLIQKQVAYSVFKIADLGNFQIPVLQTRAENNIVRPEAKIGRNDPCPCGSGKKYKKCCCK